MENISKNTDKWKISVKYRIKQNSVDMLRATISADIVSSTTLSVEDKHNQLNHKILNIKSLNFEY